MVNHFYMKCFFLLLNFFFWFGEVFRGSYGLRSVVVHLDTRYPFLDLDPTKHKGRQFVFARMGNQELACGDLSIEATRFTNADVMSANATVADFSRWSSLEQIWTLDSQMLRYFVQSKTIWLTDHCFIFHESNASNFAYDVCIGRSVGKFSKENSNLTNFASKRYTEVGFYNPYLDEIYSNGTVIQHYTNEEGNQSAHVQMDCGLSGSQRIHSTFQTNEQEYFVNIKAPSFCDWSQDMGTTEDSRIHWLVQNLLNWCTEYTADGVLSYKYCFPSFFMQYTGNITPRALNDSMGRVLITQTESFSKDNSNIQDSLDVRLKRLNLTKTRLQGMFLESSLKPTKSVLGRPLECLTLTITSGAGKHDASDTSEVYEATIFFYCSQESLYTRPLARITRVRQTTSYKYEIYIVNPLVCSHPSFLPRSLALPETVVCYPLRPFLEKNTSFVLPSTTPNASESVFRSSHLSSSIQYRALENSIEKVSFFETFKRYSNSGNLGDSLLLGEHDVLDGTSVGYFASGLYKRYRNVVSPMFFVGMPVRHQRLGVIGVILGWDPTCRVPKQRRYEYELTYSQERLNDPHYLLRLSENTLSNFFSVSKNEELYLYSPQFLLEFVDVTKMDNIVLQDEYLGDFDRNLKYFHFSNKSIAYFETFDKNTTQKNITLETLYPDEREFAERFVSSS